MIVRRQRVSARQLSAVSSQRISQRTMKQKTVFACQECGAQAPSGSAAAPSAGRGTRSSRSGRCRRRWRPPRRTKRYSARERGRTAALRRHRHGRRRAADDRHRRVRSRARRRRRARIARAHRRRARHRQVDAAAAGGGALRRRRFGPVLYCSGEESEHQIKSRGRAPRHRGARRSTSLPRPASSESSRRSRGSGPRSSSSTRSRRSSR